MTYTIHHGDCLEWMKTLPCNSVDSVITDPPYGLSFMGKHWDKAVPGPEYWAEALRVAKPGATALVFAGTKLWHRMACALEDAGWEPLDCFMWCYGSGFPKSLDISKALDKEAGAEREVVGTYGNRDGVVYGMSRTRVEQGARPTVTTSSGNVTAPATPLAKQWHGWGTALKPAWEPILVMRKPCEGTFANNAREHGVAGLWIDGCRVPAPDGVPIIVKRGESGEIYGAGLHGGNRTGEVSHAGRWPANLMLDEEAAAVLDAQADASRFFYVAKSSPSDRNYGMPPGTRNTHPTVKPLALMRQLCRITRTPTGGTVLDPFAGSFSTAVACILEGRDVLACDMETEHCEIGRYRCAYATQEHSGNAFNAPLDLFATAGAME